MVDLRGTVEPGWERVRDAFERNFTDHGEVGAAVCVYVGDRPVVDLQGGTTAPGGGEPYGPRTLQLVASCTKGALAVCAHRLVQRGELDLDAPVSAYWPEFGSAGSGGKDGLPVRWLLSHRAGLAGVDAPVTIEDVVDWHAACAKVAATVPQWEPGTAHGYHAITYGWLVGEVLRRVTGLGPGALFAREVADPLGLDLHIGLPEAEQGRLSPLYPAPPADPPDALTARLFDPTSLAHRAFLVSDGLFGWLNDPRVLAAEVPAANGTGTAHALARMYAALVTEVDGVRLLDDDALAAARVEQAAGDDLVSGYETRYALGFQLSYPYRPMAGRGSLGHYGLGGSVGFLDTDLGFSFGYTVNQMGPGTPSDPRSDGLIAAVVASL